MARDDVDTRSTELVLVDDAKALVEVLTGTGEVPFDDPAEVQAAIIRRILAATTAEEAMQDTPTYSTKDLVGRPFEVSSVRVAKSRFGENGRGGFLVAEITLGDTGERAILTTSSGKVAAKLGWHRIHDALPQRFVVTEPIETAQGFTVYDLAYA